MTSTENKELDPYVAKAQNDDISPILKIDGLRKIISAANTGMLTTRDKDGCLHSRAMTPMAPSSETDLKLIFFANNASHKFEELNNDANVNVSFYDKSTTDWVSYCGLAKVSQDKELIKKYWNHITAGYFGDLGDGIHKGDAEDPRVAIIEVIPTQIQYWLSKRGSIGRTLQTAFGAATGKVSAPGELRTITQAEIQLTEGIPIKAT